MNFPGSYGPWEIELRMRKESSDQSWMAFLLNMPPLTLLPYLVSPTMARTESILPWACPLNFIIEFKCSDSCCSFVADAACWTSASALCDDKRPRERETGGTHHSIVRHWKPARALLKSLAIFHLFSGCQSHCFQQQFLILGYFRESFTANRNLCPELGFFEL